LQKMLRKYLLIVTAIGEGGTGLALLVVPSAVILFLLGIGSPSPEGFVAGRIAGAALVAIGIACWFAKSDQGSSTQRGLLIGVLAYDISATLLLTYAGLSLEMQGILLWPAVTIHGLLTIWCFIALIAT
jgi:hypothetical protein